MQTHPQQQRRQRRDDQQRQAAHHPVGNHLHQHHRHQRRRQEHQLLGEPSCQSSRNNRSITSSAASSAATHTTPGAICASSCGAAPTPNGNRVMTIRKNQSGLRISAPLRHAGAVPGPTAHASLPASRVAAEAQGAQRTAQRPQRLVGGEDGASPAGRAAPGDGSGFPSPWRRGR